MPGLHPLPPASWNRYGLGMRRQLDNDGRRHRRHFGWFFRCWNFPKKSGKNCWKNGRRHFFFGRNGSPMKVKFVFMKGCFVKETFDENESQKRFREETYLKMLKRSKGKNWNLSPYHFECLISWWIWSYCSGMKCATEVNRKPALAQEPQMLLRNPATHEAPDDVQWD